MKTAVSIPDDLFEQADRLAQRSGRSRSAVYSAALLEYVERHDPDEVRRVLDEVIERVGRTAPNDDFIEEASRRTLDRSEW